MIVVITTAPDRALANTLADKLVVDRLAACVQILPQLTSIYSWKGKIEKADEHLLLIKTLPEKYEAVEKYILDHHSYDTPEIVAIAAERVSDAYLSWAVESVKEGELGVS